MVPLVATGCDFLEYIMSNLELNKGDQFIIALDISGSMGTRDCPNDATRIAYVQETLRVFTTEAAKWDPDGVSLYAFGAACYAHQDQQPDQIDQLITQYASKLEGMTMTHLAIEQAYKEHKSKGSEQTFLLLFTDGDPSDRDAVKKTIARITNEVTDEKEFRIGFITVGNRTSSLNEYLTDLDDNLKEAKYDIVDVKKLEEVDFYAAVNGALTD